jgi:hypothetical protein
MVRLSDEYCAQGDAERALGMTPGVHMDRQRASCADMSYQFTMKSICERWLLFSATVVTLSFAVAWPFCQALLFPVLPERAVEHLSQHFEHNVKQLKAFASRDDLNKTPTAELESARTSTHDDDDYDDANDGSQDDCDYDDDSYEDSSYDFDDNDGGERVATTTTTVKFK